MSITSRAPSDTIATRPRLSPAATVLVTGGTGFLGTAVLRALAQRGVTPLLFRRPGSRTDRIADVPRKEIFGDLQDLDSLHGIIHTCDAVIHCAAVTDMATTADEALEHINVQATAQLAALCRQAGACRLVYVSSTGTMGPIDGVTDETAPFLMTRNRYFTSKYRAEQVVLNECRQGLDAVIVNPTAMVGAIGLSPNHQRLLRQATRQMVCVTLPGGSCFVSVDDIANGILLAVERGQPGERYILGGVNLTFCEYARLIAAVAHRRPIVVRMPAAALRTAAAIGWLARPLWPAGTLRDPSVVALLCAKAFYSSTKATKQLGYQITPLADILPAIIARYG